jgi:hypothetical protein
MTFLDITPKALKKTIYTDGIMSYLKSFFTVKEMINRVKR